MRIQCPGALLVLVACGGPGPAEDAGSSDAGARDAGDPRDAQEDVPVPLDAGPPPTAVLYVGQDDGDLVARSIDAAGAIAETSRTRTGDFPAFAAIAPSGRFLYAVNEGSDEVVALSVAPRTGATALIGAARSSGGNGPTHVSVDRSGRWVLVANYGAGSVAVLPVGTDGTLGAAIDVESPGGQAHQILTDPTNRWALVPCKAADRVAVLAFDEATGALTPSSSLDTASGAGPRHIAFDSTGTRAYLVNELGSTVQALTFDPATGALASLQTLSALPAGFGGTSTGAEILVDPRDAFVYASNRGHDSIAIFAIQGDGTLAPRGHAMLGGRTPRSMALDPSGAYLVAGAQGSGYLVRFSVDAAGMLTRLGQDATDGAPFFVGIFEVPGA
jgi:6-phosphogluconolactonase